jgi:hypothetical protein
MAEPGEVGHASTIPGGGCGALAGTLAGGWFRMRPKGDVPGSGAGCRACETAMPAR